jgi:hypothetical protein
MLLHYVILAVLLVALDGCYSVGPNSIKGSHPLYNDAVVSVVDQQFLANLVRLKYRDTPYFLDVTNIVNSFQMGVSGGVNGTQLYPNNAASNFVGINAEALWTTTPTVTFQPVEGEGFVKKFLTPISLDSLVLLVQAGWSLHRVFGLCVEQVNGVRNAVTASGPTPAAPPLDYQRFSRLLVILDDLRTADAIRTDVDPVDKSVRFELRPTPGTENEVDELKDMLGLDPDRQVFQVTSDLVHQNQGTIALRTRSPLSVLFYLSQNVEVPEEHAQSGLVTVTQNADGSPFPWSHTPAGSRFRVRSSDSQPGNAYTSIPYRGHWFYLADNDLESKSSFMLMSQVFRLQAGSVTQPSPVLTIPVTR